MSRDVRNCTVGCVPIEDVDQPVHSRSLIRIFNRQILDSQGSRRQDFDQGAWI